MTREEILRAYYERKRCKKTGQPIPDWAAKVISPGASAPRKPIVETFQVTCGSSVDLMRQVPQDAFVISDPPYNQGYHYDKCEDDLPDAEYRELLRSVFQGRRAVVMHYPEEMINIVAPSIGGRVEDVMTWVYPSNQPKQHRLVGWWNCKPDWSKTPQDYKNPTDKRVMKLISEGKRARGYDWIDVNHVKNVQEIGHPCPIPYDIAERLVLSTTEPGDMVVDPFCGSGTVLVAAVRNGRRAIGFDVSEKYCELARESLKPRTKSQLDLLTKETG